MAILIYEIINILIKGKRHTQMLSEPYLNIYIFAVYITSVMYLIL